MSTFDISDTLAPNSDQLDAVDLLGGPQTFTITSVSKGNSEQPVQVRLAEFPRPWRPGKSMRRVLAACWGTDASAWVGRRVTLYCDETIRFGSDVVGGTRISHLSHIGGKAKSIPLLVSRGKSATYKVQPLPDEPTTEEKVAALRKEWKSADADRRQVIEAEVLRLTSANDTSTYEPSSGMDEFHPDTTSNPGPSDDRDAAAEADLFGGDQ